MHLRWNRIVALALPIVALVLAARNSDSVHLAMERLWNWGARVGNDETVGFIVIAIIAAVVVGTLKVALRQAQRGGRP